MKSASRGTALPCPSFFFFASKLKNQLLRYAPPQHGADRGYEPRRVFFELSIFNCRLSTSSGRKERRATTTGTSRGARGCWRVGSGFAEVVRLVGPFSAGAAHIARCRRRNPFETKFEPNRRAVSDFRATAVPALLKLFLRCRTASFFSERGWCRTVAKRLHRKWRVLCRSPRRQKSVLASRRESVPHWNRRRRSGIGSSPNIDRGPPDSCGGGYSRGVNRLGVHAVVVSESASTASWPSRFR